jgi:hypothetical protein
MITCVIHYTIDPRKIDEFERFAHAWMRLVTRDGGQHHGYFLPAEGASDAAPALFSFESLATCEGFRSPAIPVAGLGSREVLRMRHPASGAPIVIVNRP